jgi:cell division protein FtsZ
MAMMGTGLGHGEHRALEAAQKAVASPLLDDASIAGAKGILINFTGGSDLALHEVEEAARIVQEAAHEEANIIFGAVIDPGLRDEVRMTVIATGFTERRESLAQAAGRGAGRGGGGPGQRSRRAGVSAPPGRLALDRGEVLGGLATRHLSAALATGRDASCATTCAPSMVAQPCLRRCARAG